MVYRVDEFREESINPITKQKYDSSWIILILTDSADYEKMCGSNNGCAYTIKISRSECKDWKVSVGDCMSFNETNGKNIILVMSEAELEEVKRYYKGHSYNESCLRENEPFVLIHSTQMESWKQIEQAGMLRSWNKLKERKVLNEEQPIGVKLGDPMEFSDYIMFGAGITGEIVVNSKQHGEIVMDFDMEYLTGARLYFDANKMAQDGLLIRDGCHLKVKDTLPLVPYLMWVATWDVIGLESQISTPRIFAEMSDAKFKMLFE